MKKETVFKENFCMIQLVANNLFLTLSLSRDSQ